MTSLTDFCLHRLFYADPLEGDLPQRGAMRNFRKAEAVSKTKTRPDVGPAAWASNMERVDRPGSSQRLRRASITAGVGSGAEENVIACSKRLIFTCGRETFWPILWVDGGFFGGMIR